MPKLLITHNVSSKPKDIDKMNSQFRYDSNMSGFSDLDYGIKFNFLGIYLVVIPKPRISSCISHILSFPWSWDHFYRLP